MSQRPPLPYEREQARMSRIRDLREQREGPVRRRRRFEPIVLVGWLLVVMLVAAVAIGFGFVAFAPRLMAWVEDNPGALEHGVVVDFVRWYEPSALADAPASDSRQRVTVTVPEGASDTEIGQLLFDAGLVANPLAFQYAVMQAGREGTLQAGPYDLSPSLTPSQIVAALRQEEGHEIAIRIGEAWRLEEIAAYLATTEMTLNIDQFVALVRNPPAELIANYDFLRDLPAGRSLEGYLYPDTYRVDANASALELATLLLDTFGLRLTPEMRQQLADRGMSIDQAVNLASIVEREAVLDEERPLIAGVYINRLRTEGWRLDADPTLQYALATQANAALPIAQWGEVDWWPPLPAAGADVELPEELMGYQTYRNDGLPPTPIAAPRIESVAAVAAPNVENGYYFFVAACPNGERNGSHRFAATLDAHNRNVAQAAAECPAP